MWKRALVLTCITCGGFTVSAAACDASEMRFGDAFIQYGPSIFSAMTSLARCGDYRVFVVHANGTDMLFLDKLVPSSNGASLLAADGMPFVEFNHYEASAAIHSVTCKVLDSQKLQIGGEAHSFHTDKAFRFSINVDIAKKCYEYEDTTRRQSGAEQAHARDVRNARA